MHGLIVFGFDCGTKLIQNKVFPRIELELSVEEPEVVDLSEDFHIVCHHVNDVSMLTWCHWFVIQVMEVDGLSHLLLFWMLRLRTVLRILVIVSSGHLWMFHVNCTLLLLVRFVELIKELNFELCDARLAWSMLWLWWSVRLVVGLLLALHVIVYVHSSTEIDPIYL